MVSIPKKTTEEVDWTNPIRNLIAKSYGENPDAYTQECQALQRCRQDAVKGAGSDMTGRFTYTGVHDVALTTITQAAICCTSILASWNSWSCASPRFG
jgi:hypothetical protein